LKVLIIGGTGFISSNIVKILLAMNHNVSTFTRGNSPNPFAEDKRVKIFKGDRNDKKHLEEIAGNNYDVVIDMIAYEPINSLTSFEAFAGKIGRFIHCSTISVYMISNEVQCPVTEDQDKGKVMPFFARNPFGMDYGINKRMCEEFLWSVHKENHFPVTTVRPPYVCGPNDPAKRDYFWIERILDGKPLLVPGCGEYATQLMFVEDLAKTVVDIMENQNTIGNSYNVASEEIFSLNEYLERLAKLLNRKIEIVNVDQNVFDRLPFSISKSGDVFPFNTRRTAIFSLEKIKNTISYNSTPFVIWMNKTIKWFTENYTDHSYGYENREKEIRFIEKWKKQKKEFIRAVKNEN